MRPVHEPLPEVERAARVARAAVFATIALFVVDAALELASSRGATWPRAMFALLHASGVRALALVVAATLFLRWELVARDAAHRTGASKLEARSTLGLVASWIFPFYCWTQPYFDLEALREAADPSDLPELDDAREATPASYRSPARAATTTPSWRAPSCPTRTWWASWVATTLALPALLLLPARDEGVEPADLVLAALLALSGTLALRVVDGITRSILERERRWAGRD